MIRLSVDACDLLARSSDLVTMSLGHWMDLDDESKVRLAVACDRVHDERFGLDESEEVALLEESLAGP